jgi:hypothetical protein
MGAELLLHGALLGSQGEIVDSRSCSGHTGRSLARGAGYQVPKLCIYRGSGEIFSSAFAQKILRETVTRRAVSSRSRGASCRRAPEVPRSSDRTDDGKQHGSHNRDQVLIGVLARKFAAIAATLEKSRTQHQRHTRTFRCPSIGSGLPPSSCTDIVGVDSAGLGAKLKSASRG